MNEFSVLELFLQASLIVQAVMVLLLLVSIISWIVIFERYFNLNRIKEANKSFDLKYEGKIYKTIKAKNLWNDIVEHAHSSAEPGLLFWDTMKDFHNAEYCSPLVSTNPCAEQPLPDGGCCNLGAINLERYVDDKGNFMIESFKETISTATAIGIVDYIHVENVNQATIYIKDSNGQFTDSGSAQIGSVSMGTYVAVNPLNSAASFGGWWKVSGLTAFTSSVKDITTPQFVVQDIITTQESKSPEVYYNTMDDVYALNQITDPTKGGKLGHLSFYNKQGQPDLSPYWFFRAPKAWTDTLTAGDTFKMEVNQIRNSLGTVFDPATLGINLSYTNQALGHQVYDLWDGYVDVTFTNFSITKVMRLFLNR